MPEGPEVRRAAAALDDALAGREIRAFSTRIKTARAWLREHGGTDTDEGAAFVGRRIARVRSHGKWLWGEAAPTGAAAAPEASGGPALGGETLYFASHFLMWGRWHVVAPDDELAMTRDKRERARIEVDGAVAVLTTAPKFAVGTGDPCAEDGPLAHLGPDTLPYEGPEAFDVDAFHDRLLSGEHHERTLGAVLLDQTVLAGVGNYLRAEILHACRLDPWMTVGELTPDALACLDREIPAVCAFAYAHGGRTITDEEVETMRANPDLHYGEPHEWNLKHRIFRRTNLACLVCGDTVRQKKQVTRRWVDGDGEPQEKRRPIYFCPTCQNTSVELKPVRKTRKKKASAAKAPAAKAPSAAAVPARTTSPRAKAPASKASGAKAPRPSAKPPSSAPADA